MNQLDKLKELNEKSTPGPWETIHISHGVEAIVKYVGAGAHLTIAHGGYPSETELIALSRNMLPLFLELVETCEYLDKRDELNGYIKLVLTKLKGSAK